MTDTVAVKSPKKLIEVALPLDAINAAAAKEKSIRHGHPSTLHLWWARRPLAAARAVIFAQAVNDPSWKWELDHPNEAPPSHLKATWANSRKRLFALIEQLVTWENTTDEALVGKARAEIRKSWAETCEANKDHPEASTLFNPDKMPALYDPFAGGGTIPLEAQRLGFDSFASDLNPVAVTLNKATVEIPSRFSGLQPVNPTDRFEPSLAPRRWSGAQGLAADVRYYGRWMLEQAQSSIGSMYPKAIITREIVDARPDLAPLLGQELTVVAWIWARTVKSPNPAFRNVDVPLATTFVLSSKAGREAYVEPVLSNEGYRLIVQVGEPTESAKTGTKLSRGANFRCVVSDTAIESKYIYAEAIAGRMGAKLLAVVAESPIGRVYLSPTPEMEATAAQAVPEWKPATPMPENPRWFSPPLYGLTTFGDLFTPRQLVALTTLSDLVGRAIETIREDAIKAGFKNDDIPFRNSGTGALAYAEAVGVYLAFCVDKATLTNTTQATWQKDPDRLTQGFSRQAIPMTWDFAEANPTSEAGGGFGITSHAVAKVLERMPFTPTYGEAVQQDASGTDLATGRIISTDPPYYDNIGYADLSDYFYVWMRRSLRSVFPEMFATMSVPKAEELVATPYRHGGKEPAEAFFLDGMTKVMKRLASSSHPAFPVTIYYAFKQSETENDKGTGSTGWETFLDAVIRAGFEIHGTWPMRTELTGNLKKGINALASSIVLVCRPRSIEATTISRRTFIRELNQTLPEALDKMTRGSGDDASPVAPVDLSQAIIGPGMAIFSKYAEVLEADGSPMSVKTALRLINRFLAEDDFDADTQFCLHWFEQHGWDVGGFGEADQLARAKGTAVNGVVHAGVLESGAGKVRLLKPNEYSADWSPEEDGRLPVWEALHQLIRVFRTGGYESAGKILAGMTGKADPARQLAYRLYTLCERKNWPDDARAYNELITSWSAIEDAASTGAQPRQSNLFDR